MDFDDMLRDLEETEQSLRSHKVSIPSSRNKSANLTRKNSSSGSEEPEALSDIDSDSSPNHHGAAKGKHKLVGSLSRTVPPVSDSGFREAQPGRRRPKEAHSQSIRDRISDEEDDEDDEWMSGRMAVGKALKKVENRRTPRSDDDDDENGRVVERAGRKEHHTRHRKTRRSDDDKKDDENQGGRRLAGRAVRKVENPRNMRRNDRTQGSSGTESESEDPRKRAPVKQDARRPVVRDYSDDDDDPIDRNANAARQNRRRSSEEDDDYDGKRRWPGTGDSNLSGRDRPQERSSAPATERYAQSHSSRQEPRSGRHSADNAAKVRVPAGGKGPTPIPAQAKSTQQSTSRKPAPALVKPVAFAKPLVDISDVRNCQTCGCSEYRSSKNYKRPDQCSNCLHEHKNPSTRK